MMPVRRFDLARAVGPGNSVRIGREAGGKTARREMRRSRKTTPSNLPVFKPGKCREKSIRKFHRE
jgi:hypothetical protein